MASLAVLRDQIIRRLVGGDQISDSQIDPREIELLIFQVLNAAIKIEYFTNIRAEDVHGVSGQYIAVYVRDVLKDLIRKEEYITLPQPFVALPGDKGLDQITPMNGKCKFFIPVKVGFSSLFNGLAAGNLELRTGFYPERNKVFFTKSIIAQGTSKVMCKLIVAAGDDVVIDPAQEESIIRAVMEIMIPKMPQDKVVDNVDNPVNSPTNG